MQPYLPLTLGDLVASRARLYPHAPAWTMAQRTLTNLQVHQRGRQLAHALENVGVQRQDRVGILAMNCLEYVEVFAAGWTTGIIISTVNFRLAPAEIEWIITDSSPRVLVFEAQYLATIEALRTRLTSVEKFVCIGGETDWAQNYESFVATGEAAHASFHAVEQDLALLIYTSGTTGRPKGCMLGHRELRQLAIAMAMDMHCEPQDRALLVMPLFHIGATGVALAMLCRDGALLLQRQFDPPAYLDCVENERIALLHLAPTMVQTLLEQPGIEKRNFSQLNTLLYSAAPMPSPVLKRGLEIFGNVFLNMYGQSEVSGTVLAKSFHRPDGTEREKRWLISVGRPALNTEVKLVDDDGQECAIGEAGEVLIKSNAMFRGYWNNTAATLETIRNGWCHTGDIGRFDEDGMLYLVDRKKDVIVSGGENIYSREVEEAVLQHAGVSEVAAIGVPDAKWGEAVCTVIVLKEGVRLAAADIVAHTQTLIAKYKSPKHVRFVDALAKLPSGKVNKVSLRKTFMDPSGK